MEVGRKSSTFWGLSKKFSTNSQVWEKVYLMSKWYMFLLRCRTTMSPSFRPSCLQTNYQLLTILQGSSCWRKLGGKEEVKFKMSHSWYFGNHIRHQGPMWPWPQPPDRIDQGRPQWNQGQPPDGRARRGTRNNCYHQEHWVRVCHFPRRNNQARPFQRPQVNSSKMKRVKDPRTLPTCLMLPCCLWTPRQQTKLGKWTRGYPNM